MYVRPQIEDQRAVAGQLDHSANHRLGVGVGHIGNKGNSKNHS